MKVSSKISRRLGRTLSVLAVVGALVVVTLGGAGAAQNRAHTRTSAAASKLTVVNGKQVIHGLATPAAHRAKVNGANFCGVISCVPPLKYNGGSVMQSLVTYAIYWLPPTLQSGATATQETNFATKINTYIKDLGGHSLYTNATQYFQNPPKKYIQNKSSFGGSYVDTTAYPASGSQCSGVGTVNCVADSQIQAEIAKVKALKGWTSDPTHLFSVFTANGETECGGAGFCAYSAFCAYHTSTGGLIYSYEPYAGNTAVGNCLDGGTYPNNAGGATDSTINAFSHEQFESVTDPNPLSGWTDQTGQWEIGDVCAYTFGTNTWGPGLNANQQWNGHNYELQEEFDNHVNDCVQVGP